MSYLSCCILESLRYGPSTQIPPLYVGNQDVKIGGCTIKKGTRILWDNFTLSRLSSQWQQPEEFLPDRFDPSSPLFLTPSGKKRHSHLFSPWGGVKRSCAGQILAEVCMRMITTSLLWQFDFDFYTKEERTKNYRFALETAREFKVYIKVTHKKDENA